MSKIPDPEEVQKRLDDMEVKLRSFMESIGMPPHILAAIAFDEQVGADERQFAAAILIPSDIKLPHFQIMMAGIFASVSKHNPVEADRLLSLIAQSTHAEIAAHQRAKTQAAREHPPHTMN